MLQQSSEGMPDRGHQVDGNLARKPALRLPVGHNRSGEESSEDAAAIEAVWQDLVAHLCARGRDLECEDDVQETIVGVLEFLARHRDSSSGVGPQPARWPSQQELFAIADRILRCRRADRLRRRQPQLLGEGDRFLAEPDAATSCCEIPNDLRRLLRPKALELLQAWLDGCRSKKALARQLATSAAAIRQRMRRLVEVLRQYMNEQAPKFSTEGSPSNDL